MSGAKETPEAKLRSELLCPVHASLDATGKLKPFDNCVACIRVERDELQAGMDDLLKSLKEISEYDGEPNSHDPRTVMARKAISRAEGYRENQ